MGSLAPAPQTIAPPSAAWARPAPGPLRVLHLQSGRQYGGIQRMLVCLAESREHCLLLEPVFALCFQEQLARELIASGADVRDLGPARARNPWGIWRANRRLRGLLLTEQFDAVICHGSPLLALFGFTVRHCGVPLVYWMHNDVKQRNKNFSEFVASRQRPDLVIANSEFTAASIPLQFAWIPPHVVIPCPVTPPAPRVQPAVARAQLRREANTPADAVVITLVGRPEVWKGHAQLLEALARLRDLPGWHCWMIGGAFDPEQAAFLESLRAAATAGGIADRVHFLGQRQDVDDLLLASDIFCQPNLTPEPFGIVFIEALYAGLPVVSVDHGGAKEIVDATCGRLVPPNDPAALAGALEELVRDSGARERLSRQAPLRGAAVSDPGRVLAQVHSHLATLGQTLPASTSARL